MPNLDHYFPSPGRDVRPFDATSALEAHEAGTLSEAGRVALVQHLVSSGAVWLMGADLRKAALALHARGLVTLPYRPHH